MEYKIINDKFNGVRIVQRDDGKFGVQEIIDGETMDPVYRYRTEHSAALVASSMSAENNSNDAYVASHS